MIWRDAPLVTTEDDEVEIPASVKGRKGLRIEGKPARLKATTLRHPYLLPTMGRTRMIYSVYV